MAMVVFFLLLLLIVQVAFLVITRTTLAASVDAAARRSSWVGVDLESERDRFGAELERAVPGARILSHSIERSDTAVTVEVSFRWVPAGPDLLPVEMTIGRSHALVVPP